MSRKTVLEQLSEHEMLATILMFSAYIHTNCQYCQYCHFVIHSKWQKQFCEKQLHKSILTKTASLETVRLVDIYVTSFYGVKWEDV
jgi:hypothetical protein